MARRLVDRTAAGAELATRLTSYARKPQTYVLALPRGGVPVAAPVAAGLGLPLDVLNVRKLGAPRQPELALGALAPGVEILDRELIRHTGVGAAELRAIVGRGREELERRERVYRAGRRVVALAGATTIVVDDGLATGASMMAAIGVLRRAPARRIIVAVPVATPATCALIAAEVQELVVLLAPDRLGAVGLWYQDFSEVTDEQVQRLLRGAASWESSAEQASEGQDGQPR